MHPQHGWPGTTHRKGTGVTRCECSLREIHGTKGWRVVPPRLPQRLIRPTTPNTTVIQKIYNHYFNPLISFIKSRINISFILLLLFCTKKIFHLFFIKKRFYINFVAKISGKDDDPWRQWDIILKKLSHSIFSLRSTDDNSLLFLICLN